ncbi:MAG: DUF4179 domain-containing protein [Clostridiales bacterium]|nr:DUF4179 domain-containing protein [Clostridiales bacterium]
MNLKDRYKRAFQGVTPDPTLFVRTEEQVLGATHHSNYKRPAMRTVLIAATLMLSLLATVAFATGWAQSIFASLVGSGGVGTDFEKLDELAQQQVGQNSTVFAKDASLFDFEVSQAYYDGEQLMLGTAWRDASTVVDLSFGPDSEHFADLKPLQDSELASSSPEGKVSGEAWEAFQRTYKEKGAAGIVYYICYPGDGVYLGDEQIPPWIGDGGTLEDGRTWAYTEYEVPLPEAARDKESLTLTALLYRAPVYYYQTGEGAGQRLQYIGEREKVDFTFTVLNNHAQSRTLTESATFLEYGVEASINLTAVQAQVHIYMEIPTEWKGAIKSDEFGESTASGVDYVLTYNAYVDGTAQKLWISGVDKESFGIDGTLTVPDGAKQISLRPVYSLSGEHAAEEILFKLD